MHSKCPPQAVQEVFGEHVLPLVPQQVVPLGTQPDPPPQNKQNCPGEHEGEHAPAAAKPKSLHDWPVVFTRCALNPFALTGQDVSAGTSD